MMPLHVLAAGKISRRVSLVHYPEPSELKQNSINLKQMMAQRSSATTLTNSSRRFATPTQSTRTRSIMQSGSSSKSTKRKHSDGLPAKPNDQAVQDSGKSGHSALTSSGSFDQSKDQKSKKKRKIDRWSKSIASKCSESNSFWLKNLFPAVLEQLHALTIQPWMQNLLWPR